MGSGVGGAVFDLIDSIGFLTGVLIEGRAFFLRRRGPRAGRRGGTLCRSAADDHELIVVRSARIVVGVKR